MKLSADLFETQSVNPLFAVHFFEASELAKAPSVFMVLELMVVDKILTSYVRHFIKIMSKVWHRNNYETIMPTPEDMGGGEWRENSFFLSTIILNVWLCERLFSKSDSVFDKREHKSEGAKEIQLEFLGDFEANSRHIHLAKENILD